MNHIGGIAAMAALASLLMNPTTGPYTCQPEPQPSHTGLYVGLGAGLAGVAIGTVILVDHNQKNHNVKGCVTMGPNGFEVHNEADKKTYALSGVTTNTKVGDEVKLHGAKEKRGKNSVGEQTFVVEKMSRDFGPCAVTSATQAMSQPTPDPASR